MSKIPDISPKNNDNMRNVQIGKQGKKSRSQDSEASHQERLKYSQVKDSVHLSKELTNARAEKEKLMQWVETLKNMDDQHPEEVQRIRQQLQDGYANWSEVIEETARAISEDWGLNKN